MDQNPLRDQFRMHRVPGSCAVVIFGGLGDLAGRKLVPALYNLYLRRLLPAGFSMIGIGRTDPGGDEGYRKALRERCASFSRTAVTDAEWDGFAELLNWITGTEDALNRKIHGGLIPGGIRKRIELTALPTCDIAESIRTFSWK